MGRRRAPWSPSVYDRLGDEQEALRAVGMLWVTLAATPDDARSLLLAHLAHKQTPAQLADLLHSDPKRVTVALDNEHSSFAWRFRAAYEQPRYQTIPGKPPRLPESFPRFSTALFAYLEQARGSACWTDYLTYLDNHEVKRSATFSGPGHPPSFRLASPQRLPASAKHLAGADLAGADLAYADLTDAELAYADLTGADLTGADLAYADLTGADLTGADLAEVVWTAPDEKLLGTVWPSPEWEKWMQATSETTAGTWRRRRGGDVKR